MEYGDVTDSFRMFDVIDKYQPDYIIHYGAQALNGVSFESSAVTMQVNVMGTLNIVEAVRR